MEGIPDEKQQEQEEEQQEQEAAASSAGAAAAANSKSPTRTATSHNNHNRISVLQNVQTVRSQPVFRPCSSKKFAGAYDQKNVNRKSVGHLFKVLISMISSGDVLARGVRCLQAKGGCHVLG